MLAAALRSTGAALKGCRVLHLGAGDMSELPVYRQLKVKTVVWVEARPLQVRAMRKICPSQRIIEACIGRETRKIVKFTESKDGVHSSALPIVDPRIPLLGHRFLQTVSVADLLRFNKLPLDYFDVLVLQLQGKELEAISTLPEEVSARLKFVFVQVTDRTDIYEGGATAAGVDQVLEMLGFSKVAFFLDSAPDARFYVTVYAPGA